MKSQKLWAIILLLSLSVSCLSKKDDDDDDDVIADSGTTISTPTISVTCSNASASRCDASANGNNGFVGIFDANEDLVALGTAVMSCDANGCELEVSSWIDEDENNVTEIPEAEYTFGAYLDIDGNAASDPTDYANGAESGTDAACSLSETELDSDNETVAITLCANMP